MSQSQQATNETQEKTIPTAFMITAAMSLTLENATQDVDENFELAQEQAEARIAKANELLKESGIVLSFVDVEEEFPEELLDSPEDSQENKSEEAPVCGSDCA